MIVCRTCGSHNADADTFCGACGEFLEWTGEKLARAEPAPPDPPPPAAASPAAALVAPAPATPVEGPGAIPDNEAAVGPRQPTAMRPQDARRRTTTVVQEPPTRRLRPGDLICGDCGEGNPPERRFCSRCGHSLHTATAVHVPWWRRLLRGRVYKAGDRPRGRGVGRAALRGLRTALVRGLAVAALLAGVLYAFAPGFRGAVNEQVSSLVERVQSWVSSQYLPVRPISVTATGELPDHPGGAATDGFNNTFWAAPDAATEPTLVLGFEQPVGLDRALVQVGGGEDFQSLGRPRELHLVYSNGRTADVTLSDTPEPQEVDLGGGDGVTSVEIHVVSAYRSVQNPGLAVSEIELFERE